MEEKRVRPEAFDVARSMLILSQFDELCRKADGLCEVVPLKGISLLRGLYAKSLDRAVGDIDLLITPAERLGEYIDRLTRHGYAYQFDFMRHQATLERKRKVALRSKASHLAVDVDLHTAFVTKKFFSRSVEAFNRDALARCRAMGGPVRQMEPIDEWLFLAQHACFHQYSDPKWLRDLDLLARTMSPVRWQELLERAHTYGFERVAYLTTATLHALDRAFPHPCPNLRRGWLFRRFTKNYHPQKASSLTRKLTKLFWEFLFIDRPLARLRACCQLLLPSPSLLRNIYRTDRWFVVLLLYPVHLILSLLAIVLFGVIYLAGALFRGGCPTK